MFFVVAHGKDVDGIACHAILHRYAKFSNLAIKHFFVSYSDFNNAIYQIEGEGEIVIADIGYNPSMNFEKIKQLSEKFKITWIDHHIWPKINLPVNFIINKKYCAAELVCKHFLPKDKIAIKLASLAHAHDFRKENPLAWKLYDVISSGFDKLKLTKLLAKGEFWNEELEKAWANYQKIKEEGYKFLERYHKVYNLGKYSCIIAFAPDTLSSTLATLYLQEKGHDLIICLWKDGKMSFRRNNKEINLAEIARFFNGGGREVAAGGNLGREIKIEEVSEVFEEIAKKVEKAIYMHSL
ncbi:MAG: hypothetical protein DRN95_00655 [Candidatus Hydrothermarchaeota archaeon]|nr:MAG: hypothetical protein DRN95_00655 [Candidatus Hydrothermarchaeota archaeon]